MSTNNPNHGDLNPYQPAAPEPVHSGGMSKRDRLILKKYLNYRDDPPSTLKYLPQVMLRWVLVGGMMLAAVIAVTFFVATIDSPLFGQLHVFWAFLGGAVFGAISTQIKLIRQFVLFWPQLRKYIDFDAIEQDLYGPSPQSASEPKEDSP